MSSPLSGSTARSCPTCGHRETACCCGPAPPAPPPPPPPARRGSLPPPPPPPPPAGPAPDPAIPDAYDQLYPDLMDQVSHRPAALAPPDAAPSQVAAAIARVVGPPKGQRPFRVHIDPANDGAETANAVGDLIREHFYHRIGLGDLLSPAFGR